MTRTWFITGANRGLGRAFTVAALAQGDWVVATARDPHGLDDLSAELTDGRLTVLPLDVRDRDRVRATVDRAFELTGAIEVIVNNAGYGLVGALEELDERQIRDQMDTNFYGALWVSQAAVPHLRKQGRGHIVQISTVGAVGALPLFSMYNASKWALEGFSASLADELRPFGIAVTMAQLGGFDTDWAKSSMRFAAALPAYDDQRASLLGMRDYPDPSAPPPVTDYESEWTEAAPEVAAAELLDLVSMPNPPLRKIIGPGAHEMVALALDQRRIDYVTDPKFTWPA
ncbi:SDR family NAD(P)-dependent oxidoreductase [Nocardia terpenica]|uniref:SDR family NAD(P)-dependent oxidoreductase n=1 Tax=Nocardia terpenica TaxID=455432 RepID=UPI001895E400|nr:SDR family NAD(P)-dependent oxidoreductase [Nocardia terpenica]MBF6060422.1 SDR family NAD(P)-dependent oxidoreductase [Nocardia terpenica]MBF6103682.1 SDR family NAD(P)-dependent oxidoreductase [Nocardia terpenica]MBF6111944.1 SDR family NAD(P)-dependent oxidoreductase [Nocardia terpenica]MBF6117903.1 SDR family NAD(P)-dependent oxidoreductase [Nocardia terpenica]MBF6155371.1 SDR family NAD(P)-dependent oxidoreductase [Nocardia terpenica]